MQGSDLEDLLLRQRQLEAENERLRRLVHQAGIDAGLPVSPAEQSDQIKASHADATPLDDPADKPRADAGWLEKSEDYLQAILDSATDYAIFTIDGHGSVSSWNEGASRILGWGEDEIVGQDARVIFTPEDRHAGALEREMQTASAKGRSDDERWHIRKDGSRFWASGVLMPLRTGTAGFLKILRDRTEQKKTGTALYHSEALKGAILEAALDCIVTIDESSRIVEWNPAAERTFGYPREVALGCDIAELIIPPEFRDSHRRGMAHYLATGEGPVLGKRIELEAIHADGLRFPVELSISPLRLKGRPHFTAYLRDISESRRMAEALSASEERYRLAVAAFHGATYDTDLETGYAYRAPRFYEMLGVTSEKGEPTRDWWFSRIHPEDAPRFHDALQALLEGRTAELDLEFRVRHGNGDWIWVWQRGLAVRDAEGRPLRTVGAVLDVTKRKRAEEALQRSERRYRQLMAQSPLSVQTIDPQGWTKEVNKAWEDLFGVTLAEIHDYNIRQDAQLEARGIRPLLDRAFAGETIEMPPVVFIPDRGRYSGQPLWTRTIAYPVTNDIGQVEELVLIHENITERRRAEQALRESEQRLRATYEHAFVGIAEVDADGRFLRVNEQFSVITGYSREELRAVSFLDITHPDDRETDLEQFTSHMAGAIGAYSREKRFIHKGGHIVWVELAASRVDDLDGRPLYGIRVVRDITDRKHAERQQRLLINELNHRVKNTLAIVQAIAAQTLRNATSPAQARKDLDTRLVALARAHDVLTRENWEGAGLREIVEQAIEPYGNERENRFYLRGPGIRLSPRMALTLAMALQELVTNAVKYGAFSNEAGEVHITWAVSDTSSPQRLHLRWEEIGGPSVRVPTRRGFGSRLIERILAQDLRGEVTIDFAASGVVCTVDAPLT